MSLASTVTKTLCRRSALLQANIGVLGQKLDLMEALRTTLGPEQATAKFAESCPIVGASVGQHFRHSLDHMERVADSLDANSSDQLHYDIRVRGGNDEHDMDAAEHRIHHVSAIFGYEFLRLSRDAPHTNNKPVKACFLLSGDAQQEFHLESTLERELGFVCHHAIHHLAMVKIITMHTLELLPPGALPEGFGMAPSTIAFENSLQE